MQQSEEGEAAVGDGGKGADEDDINGAGMRYDLQGGGSDGATLWERELGSDICDAEGAGGVPPLGGSEDSRYVILVSRGRGT